MWRRPRMVTADTKSPAPQPGSNARGARSLRVGPAIMTRAGRRSWADNATAERREAGLPVCAGGPTPRKRGVAHHLRDTYKAVTSLGAPPIPSGVGSDEGERGTKETRRQECAGNEETRLFDTVNRKDAVRCIGKV